MRGALRPLAWQSLAAALQGWRAYHPRRRQAAEGQARRVLAIRLDLLGDVIYCMPALQGLKRAHPDWHITLAVRPGLASLFGGPPVDEVLTVDVEWMRHPGAWSARRWRELQETVSRLQAARPDAALAFHGRAAGSVAALSRAPRAFGFRGEAFAGVLTDPLPPPPPAEHSVLRCWRLAGALCQLADDAPWPDAPPPELLAAPWFVPATAQPPALEGDEGILVAVHPGSGYGDFKRWPAERWGSVLRGLGQDRPLQAVVVGSADERELGAEVARQAPGLARNLCGETSLPGLAALLTRCALVLGGDSGPVHLADALGVPALVLFGPTPLAQYRPLGPRSRSLDGGIGCSPCYRLDRPARCWRGHTYCMDELTVEGVLEACRSMLASG
jgi:ADP-heptose:LPS heptosyltransferase